MATDVASTPMNEAFPVTPPLPVYYKFLPVKTMVVSVLVNDSTLGIVVASP